MMSMDQKTQMINAPIASRGISEEEEERGELSISLARQDDLDWRTTTISTLEKKAKGA